jgi:hypothetical protein
MANTILPAQDPDPTHSGITKIDRTTVTEIAEIAANADEIQAQLDKADRGLNPLGLGKGVVPFDVDPSSSTSVPARRAGRTSTRSTSARRRR